MIFESGYDDGFSEKCYPKMRSGKTANVGQIIVHLRPNTQTDIKFRRIDMEIIDYIP